MFSFIVCFSGIAILAFGSCAILFIALRDRHIQGCRPETRLRDAAPGHSHSRDTLSLLAIPDAPPACFRHWRRSAPTPQQRHVRCEGSEPAAPSGRNRQAKHRESQGALARLCEFPGSAAIRFRYHFLAVRGAYKKMMFYPLQVCVRRLAATDRQQYFVDGLNTPRTDCLCGAFMLDYAIRIRIHPSSARSPSDRR